jgi:tRNA threonylcarbamoyladenosine biosynthesis protein TsaE
MPKNNTTHASVHLSSVHTFELGHVLGEHVKAGQVIALQGDLGAGKTTLTQGIADGMGLEDHVTSPTFTLVNEYGENSHVRLIHVDTYRLGDLPGDAVLESATFGLDEILDPNNLVEPSGDGAIVVIEWAERVASLLPQDHLLIQMAPAPDPQLRAVTCIAFGRRSAELVQSLKQHFPV